MKNSPQYYFDKCEYFTNKVKYGWEEDLPSQYMHFPMRKTAIKYKFDGWYKAYFNEKSEFHRVNGPARMWEGGGKEYYLNGKFYPDIKTDEEWIIKQIIE